MVMKHAQGFDLQGNPIQNATDDPRATPPATPFVGQRFFNTVLGKPQWWNGTVWRNWTEDDAILERYLRNPAGADTSASWYGTTGNGGPAWVYEDPRMLLVGTSSAAHRIVSFVHVDPVSGNDANPGTRASPKATITSFPLSTMVLLKRGTTYIHTGAALDLIANRHLGSYGDVTLARPIIRSTVAGTHVVSIQGSNASISDVDIDASDVANRSGLLIYGAGTADVSGIQVRNMRVTGVTVTPGSLRAGVRVTNNAQTLASNTNTPYKLMFDVDLINVDVVGCGYHGFHVTGAIGKVVSGVWRSVRLTGCLSDGNNVTEWGHGFSSFAMGVIRNATLAWTLVSGTIYRCTTNQLFGGNGEGAVATCTAVPDVESVYLRTLTPGNQKYLLKKNSTTPTTPAVGEFGFDLATQLIYFNVGSALPTVITAGWTVDACTQGASGLMYNRCRAINNVVLPASGEGHGFAFDDFSSDSMLANSEAQDNTGLGVSFNLGSRNKVINCRFVNNAQGIHCFLGGASNRVWGCIGISSTGMTVSGRGPALIWTDAALYPDADQANVSGGWRLLQYTGADTTTFLMNGPNNSNCLMQRLEDSVVVPGVATTAGYGPTNAQGGIVMARNLVSPDEAWRIGVSQNHIGFA